MVNNKIDELTKKIKEKAKKIGFDLVGIASAEPFRRAYSLIKERKLSQFISNDKDLITNPRRHLSSVKSIIALGISYASKEEINKEDEQFISFYARGKDYHLVIQDKMKELINFIRTLSGELEYIAYSDTGSLLDREVAYQAGLGWIGKSNNLINPEYGSYLFLGEILTNLQLRLDKPMESRCGNCQLCIENCPTQALKSYDLDPEGCLSYITQKKGILTEEERKNMGNNLWGCDKCLQVCPYNKDIPTDLHPEFLPVISINAKTILNFNKDNIPEAWKESAIFWRGLRILKRNTLINLGNKGENEYISLLKDELLNPSPILRTYVVWALTRLNHLSIKDILYKHYLNEKDLKVKEEIKKVFIKNKWREISD